MRRKQLSIRLLRHPHVNYLIWSELYYMKKIKLDQMKVLVTSECNLNCTHCFRSFDKHKYFISREKLFEIVDYAIETSCESISFSGGEFFAHPDAFALLDYCYDKRIKVKLLTNATNIGNFNYYKKYTGTELLAFQISLDGMRDCHDARRGQGMFDLVMGNVERLKELDFHITVSMAVDQDNMYDVLDVLELRCFDKYNFVPVAYAGERIKQGKPVINDELYCEYENIIRLIYNRTVESENLLDRCRMFPHQLGIKYDGTVYPCAVTRDYGIFCLGNLNEEPLSDLVDNYIESEAVKPLLDYMNNDFDQCRDCSAKDYCNRGCRARAYKFFHDLQERDPFCCKLYEVDFSDMPINCVFWGEK